MKKKLILVACLAVGAAALFTGISFARSNSTITLTVWTRTYPLDQQSPYYSAAK